MDKFSYLDTINPEIIDELYQKFGKIHTFIDAGSVLDPYVGKKTRKYHKTLKI
jgi:hypothetical protein